MNAVNDGPNKKIDVRSSPLRSNFIDYKKARIPYMRNQDTEKEAEESNY